MTGSGRAWHRLHTDIERAVEEVGLLVPQGELKHVRTLLSVGEEAFALDGLLRILLATRAPLRVQTREGLTLMLKRLGAVIDEHLPHLADPQGMAALLDSDDDPKRRRGLPPLRGGHVATARGTCSTCFPAGWTHEAVHAAADAVRKDPAHSPVVLPGGAVWMASPPEPIGVGVVTTGGSEVAAIVPVRPRRERAGPRYLDRERPTATELLVACVYTTGVQVLPALAGHLTAPQLEAVSELAVAGEVDLVADVAAAVAAARPRHLTFDDRRRITRLLDAFDLPVPGCDHLNERDAVLARLAGR